MKSVTAFRFLGLLSVLSSLALAASMAAAPVQDSNSGASCKITGGTVGQTTATINFSEGKSNGALWIFWATGTGTASTSSPDKSKTPSKRGSGNFSLTGLKPGTLYSILIHGESAGDGVTLSTNKYFAKGHFTTDPSTAVSRITIDEVKYSGPRYNLQGRPVLQRGATGWNGSEAGGRISN